MNLQTIPDSKASELKDEGNSMKHVLFVDCSSEASDTPSPTPPSPSPPPNQPTNQPKLFLSPSIRTLAKRISAYTTKISKSVMLILQWFGEYLQDSTRYAEVQHRVPKIQLYMFFGNGTGRYPMWK